MKNAGRMAYWLTTNTIFATLAWYGYAQDVEGARNVFALFLIVWWLMSFVLLTEEAQKNIQAKGGLAFPLWVDHAYDIAMAAFLAWHGAWFMALVMLCIAVNIAIGCSKVEKPQVTTP